MFFLDLIIAKQSIFDCVFEYIWKRDKRPVFHTIRVFIEQFSLLLCRGDEYDLSLHLRLHRLC